jgi:hypothetical protein
VKIALMGRNGANDVQKSELGSEVIGYRNRLW